MYSGVNSQFLIVIFEEPVLSMPCPHVDFQLSGVSHEEQHINTSNQTCHLCYARV